MLSKLRALIVEMITEQFAYRELLFQLTMRDLRIRYKQSVMGFGWAVFMPLVNTALFSVIFTRVAPLETPAPYPLFAFCGLWAWNFFASSLRFSVTSLTSNTVLVSKVYFPREILPVSAVIVCCIDALIASVVLFGLMAWYGIAPSWAMLFAPIVLLTQLILTTGIALALSMGNLFFRDVKYLFEAVITIAMFTTSAAYPVDTLEGGLGTLIRWNPMTGIIEAYRSTLLYGQLPGEMFIWTATVSLATFMLAWAAFHRAEFKFAENV